MDATHTFPRSRYDFSRGSLSRWEYGILGILLATALIFGVVVEVRSAFQARRKTDLGVYLRAAWAVRAGEGLYAITDDNGWHYHYPPLFAILLTPLADPPAGADRSGTVPFAVAVALWYVFSWICLAAAVHVLATALEQTSPDPNVRTQPAFCRRWWWLRLLPVWACVIPIFQTVARGQVNLLLLVFLCGTAAAMLRGQPVRSGLWLSGAICLKVIPAFLLLVPVWRRDARSLAGCAAGLVVGLGIIPAAAFGPTRAWNYYREWNEVLLQPTVAGGEDASRSKELTAVIGTDSQSLLATLHNTLHLERSTRPARASDAVHRAHWLIGGILTGVTLLAAGWRRMDGLAAVILLGALTLVMTLISPVCHIHYFSLALPLVMGLLAASWSRRGFPRLGAGMGLILTANLLFGLLPTLPGLEILRDLGLAMYGVLLVWLAGTLTLATYRPGVTVVQGDGAVVAKAA